MTIKHYHTISLTHKTNSFKVFVTFRPCDRTQASYFFVIFIFSCFALESLLNISFQCDICLHSRLSGRPIKQLSDYCQTHCLLLIVYITSYVCYTSSTQNVKWKILSIKASEPHVMLHNTSGCDVESYQK